MKTGVIMVLRRANGNNVTKAQKSALRALARSTLERFGAAASISWTR